METKEQVKPTPGPWMVSQVNKCIICPVSNPRFGICTATDEYEHTPEDEANARLIAAAPELLSALRNMYLFYANEGSEKTQDMLADWASSQEQPSTSEFRQQLREQVEKAIAKAEGR